MKKSSMYVAESHSTTRFTVPRETQACWQSTLHPSSTDLGDLGVCKALARLPCGRRSSLSTK